MANNRRRLQGRVISDKMDKTIVVAVERRKMHRVYKKVVRTTKKVQVHDESNEIPVGAIVRVVESKPLSKTKRWIVEEVVELPGQAVLAVAQASSVGEEPEVVIEPEGEEAEE